MISDDQYLYPGSETLLNLFTKMNNLPEFSIFDKKTKKRWSLQGSNLWLWSIRDISHISSTL